MSNKTCGECKHYDMHGGCNKLKNTLWIHSTNIACIKFEAKNPTNGDKIRAIADNKKFAYYICEVSTKHKLFTADDLAEWLNAPAESEVDK